MKRVLHFEIGADRPERAIKFYEEVFEWKIIAYSRLNGLAEARLAYGHTPYLAAR